MQNTPDSQGGGMLCIFFLMSLAWSAVFLFAIQVDCNEQNDAIQIVQVKFYAGVPRNIYLWIFTWIMFMQRRDD